jgi:MFS family permease
MLSPPSKQSIWLLRLACFCQVAGVGALTTYEAVHMRASGLSNATIGYLLSLQYGLIIVMGPIWGRIADRSMRYKEIVAIGSVGLVAAAWVFSYAQGLGSFLAYCFLRGFFFPTLNGIMPALAVHNIGRERQGRGFGGYRAFGSIGFMTATIVLPYLLAEIPQVTRIASLFLPMSILALIPLRNPAAHLFEARAFHWKSIPAALHLYLIAYFFISMTEPAVHGFFGAYASSLGASVAWIGVLSGMTGFMALISLPIVGHWIDLKGPRLILVGAFLAQSLRMFITAGITNPDWLWLPHLLHFMGWAGKEVGTIILVTRLVGESNKATGLTIAVSVKVLGMMVGAWMMGQVAERWDYQVMFGCIGATALIGFLILVSQGVKKDEGSRSVP